MKPHTLVVPALALLPAIASAEVDLVAYNRCSASCNNVYRACNWAVEPNTRESDYYRQTSVFR